jgi:hypothetical protein
MIDVNSISSIFARRQQVNIQFINIIKYVHEIGLWADIYITTSKGDNNGYNILFLQQRSQEKTICKHKPTETLSDIHVLKSFKT